MEEKMNSIDWNKIKTKETVEEICLVVATFKVDYSRCPNDLEIEVVQYPNGQYMGIANYEYWGPVQADPYGSLDFHASIEEAVDDAINGISMHDNPEFPVDVVFWVKPKGPSLSDKIYIDGYGNEVSHDEVLERRKKYTENAK